MPAGPPNGGWLLDTTPPLKADLFRCGDCDVPITVHLKSAEVDTVSPDGFRVELRYDGHHTCSGRRTP